MSSKVWWLIQILLLCFSILWSWRQLDKRNVEVLAYGLCFDALPSYTYCKTVSCFDIQQIVTYYTINYIFDEYLRLCAGMTTMDRLVVSLQNYDTDGALVDVWHSLIKCMTLNAGSPDYIEDFPHHPECVPIWVDMKKLALDVSDRDDHLYYFNKSDTSQ